MALPVGSNLLKAQSFLSQVHLIKGDITKVVKTEAKHLRLQFIFKGKLYVGWLSSSISVIGKLGFIFINKEIELGFTHFTFLGTLSVFAQNN